jgi:hypothetical protein
MYKLLKKPALLEKSEKNFDVLQTMSGLSFKVKISIP